MTKRTSLISLLPLALSPIIALALPSPQNGPAPEGLNAGDIAWMLTASSMVLFMTPGLAFFYGGMV